MLLLCQRLSGLGVGGGSTPAVQLYRSISRRSNCLVPVSAGTQEVVVCLLQRPEISNSLEGFSEGEHKLDSAPLSGLDEAGNMWPQPAENSCHQAGAHGLISATCISIGFLTRGS